MKTRTASVILWILQVLLAALFLFSGISKFTMPVDVMMKQSPFSLGFIRFIGVDEILGAIGLIVPAATRIAPFLTPLAAALLTIIMIGAVVTTVVTMSVPFAILPLVVGVLTAFVAYGRMRIAPIR